MIKNYKLINDFNKKMDGFTVGNVYSINKNKYLLDNEGFERLSPESYSGILEFKETTEPATNTNISKEPAIVNKTKDLKDNFQIKKIDIFNNNNEKIATLIFDLIGAYTVQLQEDILNKEDLYIIGDVLEYFNNQL